MQKGNSEHWFLNREKIHSELYNEVHNYPNQNKHLRTFINRRFQTPQLLEINTFGLLQKIQPQRIGPYKLIDTPTMVTYKLEDFSGKPTTHRSYIVSYYPKELFIQE